MGYDLPAYIILAWTNQHNPQDLPSWSRATVSRHGAPEGQAQWNSINLEKIRKEGSVDCVKTDLVDDT